MKFKLQLPKLYQKLIPQEILSLDPDERLATCESCIMSTSKAKTQTEWYQPDLKCCTFQPFVPNFVIGHMLKTEKVPVFIKNQIDQKINTNEYSLPLGFVAPVNYQVTFNHRQIGDFGQKRDWLCSYFDKEKNQCGIWRFRGAVCTTFYCKSSYGKKGQLFWAQMSDYLTYIEMAFVEEALIRLDFSPRQISDLVSYINRYEGSAEELASNTLTKQTAKKLWNGYYNEQIAFFEKCYNIIDSLNANEIEEALGERGLLLAKKTLKAYKKRDEHSGN